MRRSPRSVLAAVVPPLVFGVAFLLLWEMAVKVFDFQPYFLPAPSAIWAAFRENTALIWEATKVSGLNALVGLIVGTVLGVLMSFAAGPVPAAERPDDAARDRAERRADLRAGRACSTTCSR